MVQPFSNVRQDRVMKQYDCFKLAEHHGQPQPQRILWTFIEIGASGDGGTSRK